MLIGHIDDGPGRLICRQSEKEIFIVKEIPMQRAEGSKDLGIFDENLPWTICAVLGTGGFGTVYKAYHKTFDKYVAVKVLNENSLGDRETVERFLLEARLCAVTLNHENIVKVFALSQLEDGRPYMVMELVPGESLAQYCNDRGALNWQEALAIGKQILRALAFSHSNGILHRDLKPDNVLVVPGEVPQVKVTDFGLAKVIAAPQNLTGTGYLVGTPTYLSPERIFGEPEDKGSDLYAVGCILYELLVGHALFETENLAELAAIHCASAVPTISHVPHGIDFAVRKALQKRPSDRYESAQAFEAALIEAESNPNRAPVALRSTAKDVYNPNTQPAVRSNWAPLITAISCIAVLALLAMAWPWMQERWQYQQALQQIDRLSSGRPLNLQLDDLSQNEQDRAIEQRLNNLTELVRATAPYVDSASRNSEAFFDRQFGDLSLETWRRGDSGRSFAAAVLLCISPVHIRQFGLSNPDLKTIVKSAWSDYRAKKPSKTAAAQKSADHPDVPEHVIATSFFNKYANLLRTFQERHDQNRCAALQTALDNIERNASPNPLSRCLAMFDSARLLDQFHCYDEAARLRRTLVSELIEFRPADRRESDRYFSVLKFMACYFHDTCGFMFQESQYSVDAVPLYKRYFEITKAQCGRDSVETAKSLTLMLDSGNSDSYVRANRINVLKAWLKAHPVSSDTPPAAIEDCIKLLLAVGNASSSNDEADKAFAEARDLSLLLPADSGMTWTVYGAWWVKELNTARFEHLSRILDEERLLLGSADITEKTRILMQQAQLNIRFHHYDRAEKDAIDAKSLFEAQTGMILPEPLTLLAVARKEAGKYDAAMSTLSQYIEEKSRQGCDEMELAGPIRTLAQWHLEYSQTERKENRAEQAIEQASAARDLLEKNLPHDPLTAMCLADVAKSQWLAGRKMEACQILTQCVQELTATNVDEKFLQEQKRVLRAWRVELHAN